MQREALKALFDQQAAGYDKQWERMSPIRDALHLLVRSVFAGLPEDARILCVGAGTGAEMAFLARAYPRWRFTAVDPSDAMIDVCRRRAEMEGYAPRCEFHVGYVESLPADDAHDGATCFLVSQFILSQDARIAFFRDIAARLRPGGVLASTDLAFDTDSPAYDALLRVWLDTMAKGGIDAEGLERMRAAYANDVAVIAPERVASIIESAGFDAPVRFFQAGLIHGWFARHVSSADA